MLHNESLDPPWRFSSETCTHITPQMNIVPSLRRASVDLQCLSYWYKSQLYRESLSGQVASLLPNTELSLWFSHLQGLLSSICYQPTLKLQRAARYSLLKVKFSLFSVQGSVVLKLNYGKWQLFQPCKKHCISISICAYLQKAKYLK